MFDICPCITLTARDRARIWEYLTWMEKKDKKRARVGRRNHGNASTTSLREQCSLNATTRIGGVSPTNAPPTAMSPSSSSSS